MNDNSSNVVTVIVSKTLQGEIHSIEPAFNIHNHQAAAATATSDIDNEPPWPGPSGSRGLHASIPINIAPEARPEATGSAAGMHHQQPGLGSTSSAPRRHPVEEADVSARHPVHVAYRHSDLEPVRSQEQAASGGGLRGVSSSSSSSSMAAKEVEHRKIENEGEPYEDTRMLLRSRTPEQKDKVVAEDGEEGEEEEREGGGLSSEDEQQSDGGTVGSRRLSLESKGFRMPAAVENGMGWAWDEGPFGTFPACPSSPRVFQIGIAMDTGFFKVPGSLFARRSRTDSKRYSMSSQLSRTLTFLTVRRVPLGYDTTIAPCSR